MAITVLPPANLRRPNGVAAVCDSLGRLWVHGEVRTAGNVTDMTERRAERYDPSTGSWSYLAASPEFQFQYAYLKDSLDRVIIAGGFRAIAGVSHATNRGAIYDPATNTWTVIPTMPATNGAGGSNARTRIAYWIDPTGHLWVGPGRVEPGADDYTGTITQAQRSVLTYSGGPSGTWTVQANLVSNWTQNEPLLGDGEPVAANGLAYIPLYWRYNMSTDTWTALAAGGTTNAVPCLDSTGQYIYHLKSGGSFRYDTVTDTWITRAALPGPGGGVAKASGQFIYVFGAYDALNTPTAIYQYDTVTDTWTNTGDSLSQARTPGVVVKDTVGAGFYLVEGTTPASAASNVVEYWTPGAAAPVARRSWAAVIG